MKNKRTIKNIIMILIIALTTAGIFLTINWIKNNSETNSNGQTGMNESQTVPNNGEEPPEKPEEENSETPPEIPNDGTMNRPNSNETNNNSQDLDIEYYLIFATEGLVISIIFIYLIMSKFNKKTVKETFLSSDKIIIHILSTIILTAIITYCSVLFAQSNDSETIQDEPLQFNNTSVSYSSQMEVITDEVITGGIYESINANENAIMVRGNINVNIEDVSINKSGDSDEGDNTSFYGINSAIIAKEGANLILKNINVDTNAVGANGVFSYGGTATTNNSSSDGTTITISDSKITTTKDNSGGIMTTGGGNMVATNLIVETKGISSAAIRTDRGGGNVTVDGGTYTTTGQGSPTIYSTANIKVANAMLTATSSEGIVIEGKNSVEIDNVVLIDTNSKLNGQSTTYKNIFLYQSMSGDAADGVSSFTARNSSITTNNGDTFYVTNTSAIINLENNIIINNDNTGNFLRIQKDSWGNNGSNGGVVTFTMTNQNAKGNIVVDSISILDINLKSSSYEGTINTDNSAKELKLTLDSTSTIKLTGDSYITDLDNEDSTNSNIDFNGYKLYVNGNAIN